MSLALFLRTYPGHIRSRFFRDLVLLVLLTVGLLVAVSWLLIDEMKRELADSQLANATALVREEVRKLLGPVEQQLLITRDGLRRAGLATGDRQALDERLAPVMQYMEQIAGAIYADGKGGEYFLRKEDDDWVSRLRPSGNTDSATWTRWTRDGERLQTREETLNYDPRERPWYRVAVKSGGSHVSWSTPYVFHSLQVPGVTVSIAWDEAGEIRVFALDVALSRITDAIASLPLGREGRGFLLDAEGGVYAPEQGDASPASIRGNEFFSAQERLGGPLFFDAVAAWRDEGRPSGELIRFDSQDGYWWGGFVPLADQANSGWVGVALPFGETLGIVQSRWQILALTSLAIIALGFGLVLVLMNRYSRRLRDLPTLSVDRGNYVRDLYDLVGNGEDAHLEFKSTMRTNLHTGRPGKEIELAWLKGAAAFMNTEGGILLMGVSDDGSLIGLKADGFENEDKCRLHFKNLVNQHLGAENTRFLRFEIYELEGMRIAAMECERADVPVFLRHKSSESFLIRNGPSNIELSVSRAVKYIQARF